MEYQKQGGTRGPWLERNLELNGKQAKLVSEVQKEPGNYKDDDGNVKMQDSGKIQIEGETESYNFNVNKPTINALIDAFGADSKNWCNQPLTVLAEKTRVSGKSVIAVYLIPEGFESGDDDNGYMVITRIGKTTEPIEDDITLPEPE